ncbi:Uncharacterized protein TCM_023114 [Theobroma cacao]|uniref:Uncharacterized protein n=1 Tax=Theobroma cacao TaxID=3641 RepID=A0A061EU07_THECC|nr:Uncharacterized protein TCM_023114 [Theobroma cacao]
MFVSPPRLLTRLMMITESMRLTPLLFPLLQTGIGLACNHRYVRSTADSELMGISRKACSGLGGSFSKVSNADNDRGGVVTGEESERLG